MSQSPNKSDSKDDKDSKGAATPADAAMFAPDAWRLSDQQTELCRIARELGQSKFAARAAQYDKEASFPTQNYRDLYEHGLLGICIPKTHGSKQNGSEQNGSKQSGGKHGGGKGADLKTYMLAAAEIGRYCGATALTFNMHVSSCLWTGFLTDSLDMDPDTRAEHERLRAHHYDRILSQGAIYAQPFSEGGAAAAGFKAFATTARLTDKGWIINGKKIFASLAGHADYYGALCSEIKSESDEPSRRNTMYIAIPANADGVSVVGDWDPLGMRGTVSRTLIFKDVFVPFDAQLMPRGIYFQAASRWPHMFMTLTPSYMGIAQAAYDFTVQYLRGEVPGTPPVKRRMYPTKQLAVAQMRLMLEQTKSIWFQAISEARPNPDKGTIMRAWCAQYTVMENANEICQLAIRTCGGQSMLKTLPLERLYRDSRCGSLMLPWTAELCLDKLGKGALYEPGEHDDPGSTS